MLMEFTISSGGNSSDEHEASHSKKPRKTYHRHTGHQIQSLEAFFKECPHPDESQRRQLSRDLGLEPKQVKFWFQNKRTQTKAQHERADNSVLRAENERMQCENMAIREALKNVICPSCGGPNFGEEERERSLHKLQLENAHLKEEHEKVSNLLAKYIGKPLSQLDSLIPPELPAFNLAQPSLIGQGNAPNPAMDVTANFNQFNGISDMEKALMVESATNAMEELIRLLRIDEPLWVKTSASSDGRFVIHRDSYEKMFPRPSHFKTTTARVESSKDSGTVAMNAPNLVDMMLDENSMVDLFPTIVTKAKTFQVLEGGAPGNRNGCLKLMYEQMHILSPLVPPRDFYFLRHCQQVEVGTWVIVNVSYDCLAEEQPVTRSWRLPSGCMIQQLPNGASKVTWVEHVEVDDKSLTHRLYRDLICGGDSAYGAQRWIVTLDRMCERLNFPPMEIAPNPESRGVLALPGSKRSIMNLSQRMVKNFCSILSMSGKLDFPQLSEVNNSGVRVSVRKAVERGQPSGMVVSAATSLWLPLFPENVFNFFRDEKNRVQWDVLTNGYLVQEVAHISNGAHPGNFTSVLRPFIPTEQHMLILQECCVDQLGAMIVYAPVDVAAMNLAASNKDTSEIPILPSGFIISGDGRPETRTSEVTTSGNSSSSGGSLLTVAFQILVSVPSSSKELNMECVATVNTLISSTVQRIKVALNCSDLD